MSDKTAISWTATELPDGRLIPGATFNPWTGCQKVSEGCKFCYAERDSKRYYPEQSLWGPPSTSARRMVSNAYWQRPILWELAAAKSGIRKKVFCASMADVFEDNPDVVEAREKLWALIELTQHLDWLLLTKRPENIERMIPDRWQRVRFEGDQMFEGGIPRNVWFGTSAEDQDTFDTRWPVLESFARLNYPAITFLSLEPLLGPIDIEDALVETDCGDEDRGPLWTRTVDWVIVGGESGSQHRPMDLAWAKSLRDQCREAEVPFFFKQAAGVRPGMYPYLDGETHHQFPISPAASQIGQDRLF